MIILQQKESKNSGIHRVNGTSLGPDERASQPWGQEWITTEDSLPLHQVTYPHASGTHVTPSSLCINMYLINQRKN